jgi:hypothetical protein
VVVSSQWDHAITGRSRVWRTLDGGVTWDYQDGGAPGGSVSHGKITNSPVNAVAIYSVPGRYRTVIAGTDQGVYISNDVHIQYNDHARWGKYGTGLPSSPVIDLVIDPTNNRPLAGMMGRSVWSIPLPCLADIDDGIGSARSTACSAASRRSSALAFTTQIVPSPEGNLPAGGEGDRAHQHVTAFAQTGRPDPQLPKAIAGGHSRMVHGNGGAPPPIGESPLGRARRHHYMPVFLLSRFRLPEAKGGARTMCLRADRVVMAGVRSIGVERISTLRTPSSPMPRAP